MNASTKISAVDNRQLSAPNLDCPQHDARELTGNGERAVIVLNGQTYFLRITRAGKLILTK